MAYPEVATTHQLSLSLTPLPDDALSDACVSLAPFPGDFFKTMQPEVETASGPV